MCTFVSGLGSSENCFYCQNRIARIFYTSYKKIFPTHSLRKKLYYNYLLRIEKN
jgi:hypothetical protein